MEVVEQVEDELLGFAARLLGGEACRFRRCLRGLRALGREVAVDRTADREHGEYRGARGDLPRAHQRLPGGAFALALRGELGLRRLARLALQAHVPAALDHAGEHVVRELDASHVEPLLDAQQPPVDELRHRPRCRARGREQFLQPFLGEALAVAGLGEQVILDHLPHPSGWSASARS